MAAGSSVDMEMADRYVNDRGVNDDEDMLLLDDDEGDLSGIDDRWCLVGRFLTKRNVDFQAMQHKIASLWQPGRGMYVKELNPNHFLFQFYHEIDIERVIDGSPWTFDRAPLIFERLKQGENPRMVPLNRLDFWVQLHNLESGFMTEATVRNVANHVGTFVKSDPNNFVGVWRDFLRVRVKLNIDKPLKKKMKLEKKSGQSCSLIFKYEDLPTFCFICGVLGHSERFCEKLFDTPPELIIKEYDLSLKAAPRRRQHTMGAQWLRSGVAMKHTGLGTPASSQANLNGAVNGVNEQRNQISTDLGRQVSAQINEPRLEREPMISAGIGDKAYGKSMVHVEEDFIGENSGIDSLLILDSKRRRTFDGLGNYVDIGPDLNKLDEPSLDNLHKQHNGTNQKSDGDVAMDGQGEDSSKNLFGAGSGFQARQAL